MLAAGTPEASRHAVGSLSAIRQAGFPATALATLLTTGAVTLQRTLLAALNHLLHGEKWARDRLRPFAGQTVRFEFRAFHLALGITPTGLFDRRDAETPPAVLVHLPENAPLLLVTDRSALFAKARVSGTADFAEGLSFVFKHLRWDAESDLARLVGDIAARRLARGGRDFFKSRRERLQGLSLNLLDYLSLEAAVLVQRRELEPWTAGVAAATQAAEQLEKRLQLLADRQ